MASKINPKGIFKSNSRSKGPNPKGINPGGINNKPAPKPAVKPPVKPVASKPVTNTTTPRTRGGVSKGNTPGTGIKYSGKTPINSNKPVSQGRGGVSKGNTPGTDAKYANKKPVVDTKPRTRAGVSKGETPGVGSKRKALADIKARANERLATEKAAAQKAPKANLNRTPRVTAVQRSGKPAPGPKAGQRIVKAEAAAKALKNAKLAKVGKVGAGVAIAAGLAYGGKKLYDYATGSDNKPKKDTKKPEVKKDETKKPKVEDKPVKDNPKTNWLDTAKKGNTLKYGIDAPKSKKDDSKKGSLPKAIDKAVRAADGNQPGSGYSLKFTGDRSKVAGKDKWGRSPSDKWYGFNPDKKKYEAPTMVKADTKKAETKPVVKKPTTPTTPKANTTVDKMETKPTTPIANTIEAKKEIVQPKAAATTSSASSSTSSSKSSSSTPATGAQPRVTFGNKIRGALNASRERRAERAEARGNEGRADKLRDKIEDTSKKMVMRKGGTVRKSKKK